MQGSRLTVFNLRLTSGLAYKKYPIPTPLHRAAYSIRVLKVHYARILVDTGRHYVKCSQHPVSCVHAGKHCDVDWTGLSFYISAKHGWIQICTFHMSHVVRDHCWRWSFIICKGENCGNFLTKPAVCLWQQDWIFLTWCRENYKPSLWQEVSKNMIKFSSDRWPSLDKTLFWWVPVVR